MHLGGAQVQDRTKNFGPLGKKRWIVGSAASTLPSFGYLELPTGISLAMLDSKRPTVENGGARFSPSGRLREIRKKKYHGMTVERKSWVGTHTGACLQVLAFLCIGH